MDYISRLNDMLKSKHDGKQDESDFMQKLRRQAGYDDSYSKVDQSYVNSFVRDSQGYLSNMQENTKRLSGSNATKEYENYSSRLSDLRSKADNIRSYYNAHKKEMDEQFYQDMIDYLDEFDTSSNTLFDFYRESSEKYNRGSNQKGSEPFDKNNFKNPIDVYQFLSSKDYTNYTDKEIDKEFDEAMFYIGGAKERAEKSAEDVQAVTDPSSVLTGLPRQKRVQEELLNFNNAKPNTVEVENENKNFRDVLNDIQNTKNKNALKNNLSSAVGNIENHKPNQELLSPLEISQNRVNELNDIYQNTLALKNQKKQDKYMTMANEDENFAAYVQEAKTEVDWDQDKISEIKSHPKYQRVYNQVELAFSNRDKNLNLNISDLAPEYLLTMSEDERNTYDYHYITGGKHTADQYLDTIKEELKQRQGKIEAEELLNEKGPIARTAYAGKASIDAAISEIKGIPNALHLSYDPMERTESEYAYQNMRQELSGTEAIISDLVYNTGRMTPSIAASLVNPKLGLAVAGLQSASAAYDSAVSEGYSPNEALAYGTANGISESLSHYLLGGINAFGNSAVGKAIGKTKLTSQLDDITKKLIKNPVARQRLLNIAKYGTEMHSEGMEEYFQEIIDPLVRNITLGEDNELSLVNEDAAYAYLLGALTAGTLNAPYAALNESSLRSEGRKIKSSGEEQQTIQRGLESDQGSKAWELAQEISRKQTNRETPSNYEIGLLENALNEADVQIGPEQTQEVSNEVGNQESYAQTQTRLTEMGVDKQAAAVQAKAIERLKLGDTSAIHTILESPEAKQLLARDTGVVFGTTPEQGRRAAGEIAARAQSQAGRIRQEIQPEQAASTVRQNDQQQTDTSAMQPMDHMTERETATAILPAESPALQPQTASAQQGFVPDPVMESGQSAPLKTVSEVRKPQAVWADSGEPVQVTGIQSAQNGELYVRADSDSGSTVVRASDLSYQSPEVELIYQTAAQLGTSGAKAFVYGYQPGSSFDSYYKGFMRAYHAGTANTPFEQIGSAYTAILPKETARRAYYAGQNDQTERFTNAGERSTIKTKQVKDVTYTYQAVPEGRRSENAGTIVRELELLGLSGEAIEPGLQVRQNGKMRTSQGDASTLKDGHVVVRNDTDANPKNAAAHEAFHAWWNLKLPEANAYFDAVTNGNIDFSSESFQDFLTKLKKDYFTSETSDFEAIATKKFKHELCAFVSGALYENNPVKIKYYFSMFYDWEAVETAWQKMIEAGKGRKQDDRQRNVRNDTQRHGSTQWEENRGRSTDAGRGSQAESPMAGNGETVAEGTGRTPEAESGRPRSIPQVEREGRPGNEGIYGQRSLLGLESSEAERGAESARFRNKKESFGRSVQGDVPGYRARSEHSVSYYGRAEKEKSGTDQTVGRDEGKRKTRQVKDVTYTYQAVPEGRRSENAGTIVRELELLGLSGEVIEQGLQMQRNGETKTSPGSATALKDGHVVIENNIDLNPKNVAAHEAFHAWQNLDLSEANAYFDAVTDGNIDFFSESFQRFLARFKKSYFTPETTDFEVIESERFRKEISAFVSGALYEKNPTEIQCYAPMFYDWEAVETAWQKMIEAGKGRKQDDARGMVGKIGERDGSIQWEENRGHSDDAGRGSRVESPMAGNGEIIAEEAGRTPAHERRGSGGLPENAGSRVGENEERSGRLRIGSVDRRTGRGQQGQTTGLAQNEAAKKLKGSQRAYLHVLGKLSNSRIVLDDTIQGGRANGYYDLDTGEIHIALDAVDSAYDFVAKHELTHQLQQFSPEHYRQYFDHVVSYLNQAEPDAFDKLVQKQLDGYREMGKKITRQQAMDEVVADASDAFLRDSAAIRDLVSQNRTLGQKVLDAIRSMIRKIDQYLRTHKTLHTDAARLLSRNKKALEEAQRLWTNALLSAQKNTAQQKSSTGGDVRFSIKRDADGSRYVQVDEDILEGVPQKDWVKVVKNNLTQKFPDGVSIGNELIKVTSRSRKELTMSVYSQNAAKFHKLKFHDKMAATNYLDELVKISEDYVGEGLKHLRKDDFIEFARGTTKFKIGENGYTAEIIVGITKKQNTVLYDIVNLKREDIQKKEIKKVEVTNTAMVQTNAHRDRSVTSTTTNVSQKDTGVNSIISENDKNVLFSINPNFTREYDAWDKKQVGFSFVVGKTSEALKNVGVKDQTIRWDASKIIKIKNKHSGMTDQVIKQVPRILETPIIVMESKNNASRITVFGEIYDDDQKPVLAVLELSPTSNKGVILDQIKLASAYGKDNIQNFINSSKILYIEPDKKRTDNWLNVNRLQLPLRSTNYGSNNRISYDNDSVNSSISDARDKNTEKHFSLKNVSKLESENLIERYTQTEYNDYGWVAVNEVLTPSELRKLNTQFADMLHGEKFSKNRDGYYIIPVGEENRPQNSFVFIKGTISHPKISQILRIDVENEAELDIIRGDFGERRNFESREIIEAIYGQETVYQYSAGDFEDYQTLRNQGQTAGLRRNAGSNRGVSDGGRDQSGNLGSLQDKDQVTFSLKNVSKLDYDNLIKENKKQKEMISLLEEQFQVTKGIKWDKASIDRTAQRILKQYDSTYSVQDLSENLTSLYGYLKNNPDTNTDEVHSVVTAMSKSVLEHSRKLDDAMYQEYKELRDRIRGTRLTLSDADKADLDRAGGYHQFRRDNFGRLNLTNQGIPVDVFYQELQTLYPEFFAGEEIAHPADQLIRIAEVLDTIRPVYVNPYGMNLDEAAGVLANELLESYVDIPQAKPTYADRELQKRKKLKLEYQKKIREIKAEYKAKYEEKLKEVNRQNILNIRKIQEQLKKTAAADRETIKKLERQVERLKKYNQNITHAKTAAMSVSPVTSVSVPVKKSDSSVPMKQVISEAPSYVEAAKQYGTIPKGESPVRDVAVPAQTGENARVRQFARTAIEAGATPDGMISEFEREILNGAFDYNPISDKTAQREAELTLSKKGFDGALKQWKGALKNQKAASKDDIVLAEKLYVQAAKEGNYKLAMELAAEIAEEGTRAGQTVQAMRLLNKMSGEGQLVYIERTVDRMNQDLKSRREKGKAPYLEIPQEMKETLLQSKTREEIDRAAEDIYRQLASRLPVTFADKWNAWRYLSMLGNPRTHVRNLTGNAVFLPAVKMKNLIATGLEHVYRKAGGEIERTKAFRATKESLDFAKKDYEIMADIIAGGGKMNPSDVIRDYQKIFPFKTLEKARKFNFNALEAEDRIFLKRYYVSALAGYMTANQIDPNAFVSQQILERARNYAIQEAQKATYRDASKVAGMLQHLSKTNSALGLLVEGVLPFKKTPVNILKRGVEYSPAGLLYSLTMGAKKVKTGKITAAEYIDSIASGLSGTVLFALGALLQSLGILRGGEDDDKKKEQFDRNMGYQPYSLQIGDISYTIDWLAPSSLPLFVGARVFETLTEEQEDYSVSSFAEDLQMIAEPVLSLSMLSGLNDTLSSVSYGDNGISDIAANVLASYFGQAVPTLFGQAARTVDGTRRTTYTDKNMDIPSDLQYFFQKNQNKIPAASMLSQPYIDLWGREDTQENILIRAFENFVSPGYLNAVETSAVEQELVFIYEETGDAGVFPSKAAKYFQVDGQRKDLTAQEYTMFAKAKGQKAYSLLWEMMATQAYREASAQEKAELIADVYEYATVFGKTQVSAYSTNGWKAKALQADQNGESVVEVILNRKRG